MPNAIVQIIQAMLAPAVMISACGLLLLAMNNKYSMVMGRIRTLAREKRDFSRQSQEIELTGLDRERLENIQQQLGLLAHRIKLVRNAVLSYSSAVGIFVLNSILIGLPFIFKNFTTEGISVFCFLLGMALVLVGVYFAAHEAWEGYKVIKIELKFLYS
jgi:hypothetical protein